MLELRPNKCLARSNKAAKKKTHRRKKRKDARFAGVGAPVRRRCPPTGGREADAMSFLAKKE